MTWVLRNMHLWVFTLFQFPLLLPYKEWHVYLTLLLHHTTCIFEVIPFLQQGVD
jgi:hypothetical protein